MKHDVIHHIVTNGQPTYGMPCRLVPEIFRIARQEFEPMVEIRFARHSSSSWLAPLHMVSKKSGDWRPWGDYCALNLTTVPYRYPLANIQDFTMDLRGCTVFSMLDLEKVYHLIPIAPDDVPTTAIFAPFGLFKFSCMPFGLRNTAQSFERCINVILRGLPFVFAYMDDILVASDSPSKHLRYLRVLFQVSHRAWPDHQRGQMRIGHSNLGVLGSLG